MTRQQQRCLDYITNYIADHRGVPPTYAEIAVNLGIVSKSGVSRMVEALIAQGRLARGAGKVRSLEVVDAAAPLILPREIRARLDRYCLAVGERPADVVCSLLEIFFDDLARAAVAGRTVLAAAETSP